MSHYLSINLKSISTISIKEPLINSWTHILYPKSQLLNCESSQKLSITFNSTNVGHFLDITVNNSEKGWFWIWFRGLILVDRSFRLVIINWEMSGGVLILPIPWDIKMTLNNFLNYSLTYESKITLAVTLAVILPLLLFTLQSLQSTSDTVTKAIANG